MGRILDPVGRPVGPRGDAFSLNDTVKEREWGIIHMEVGIVVRALTTMLGPMRDIIALVGQV